MSAPMIQIGFFKQKDVLPKAQCTFEKAFDMNQVVKVTPNTTIQELKTALSKACPWGTGWRASEITVKKGQLPGHKGGPIPFVSDKSLQDLGLLDKSVVRVYFKKVKDEEPQTPEPQNPEPQNEDPQNDEKQDEEEEEIPTVPKCIWERQPSKKLYVPRQGRPRCRNDYATCGYHKECRKEHERLLSLEKIKETCTSENMKKLGEAVLGFKSESDIHASCCWGNEFLDLKQWAEKWKADNYEFGEDDYRVAKSMMIAFYNHFEKKNNELVDIFKPIATKGMVGNRMLDILYAAHAKHIRLINEMHGTNYHGGRPSKTFEQIKLAEEIRKKYEQEETTASSDNSE